MDTSHTEVNYFGRVFLKQYINLYL